ncbi:DUF2490 domain-containing protein [Mucilaginibacter myungsuensis]|uniref:DUF2490 domain-containing protein n=1 Tax=Mucilaginibacter myungsuensis TaxID=649104 RepID=A0A929KZB0_9SPHI|nr:DUF2490 domain-containing protein [Mucilaginibacter myungsuensis]MBE9661634.1 DUF2490 domain-containing protein [Mucilaginibacter myungsuensis]MDN3597778.1 DUF2490 domain-containing protein [Mucilaginibacter myungsuensis]
MKKLLFTLTILIAFARTASAQTNELTGWAAWFHTQKFNDKWGISFDGQLRSADRADYLRTILLRPSVNYWFNKNQHLDVGYAYVGTNGRTVNDEHTYRLEHRTFEQFILTHKAGTNTGFTHRFRLEQRFLGGQGGSPDVFGQRFRYFIRAVIPTSQQAPFTNGTFVALQNEFFLNVQNKRNFNGRIFDQNRAYAAFGYRFNKQMDLEAGYLNQYVNQRQSHTLNHVIQVAFYTRIGL